VNREPVVSQAAGRQRALPKHRHRSPERRASGARTRPGPGVAGPACRPGRARRWSASLARRPAAQRHCGRSGLCWRPVRTIAGVAEQRRHHLAQQLRV